MNISLLNSYYEKQSTTETSVFGAEFVAMKVSVETLHANQYKLRIMGIPISEASYIYGYNMPMINNTSKLELTLNNKCNAIAYHVVHESVAMGESLTGHNRSER